MTRVDGAAVHADRLGPDDPSAARRDPRRPGRRRRSGSHYRATLRSTTLPARTGCSPGPTASSRRIAGCPGSAGRTPFDRPNHGDPFVTAGQPRASGSRSSATAPLRYATTGEQVAGSGLSRSFEARNVRDFAFTGAPDYAVRLGDRRRRGDPRLEPARASRPRRSWRRRRPPSSREAALLGPYPYRDLRRRPDRRRLRDGVAGPDVDPDRAPATCPTSSPTRRPTSGSTGSSATTRPASRSPTRRPPTSSPATPSACAGRRAARRPGST